MVSVSCGPMQSPASPSPSSPLPLSIAIAVASGASPAQGLITAIVGGFLVSLLGGSRFQIGGPAGAFIVLVNTTAATHGMDGLILAVLMSGVLLALAGWLRLGTFVKFVPYPVTVGFTAGIAIIIGSSQLKDLFGLTLAGPSRGPSSKSCPCSPPPRRRRTGTPLPSRRGRWP
jgi:SulP family sulfate permease